MNQLIGAYNYSDDTKQIQFTRNPQGNLNVTVYNVRDGIVGQLFTTIMASKIEVEAKSTSDKARDMMQNRVHDNPVFRLSQFNSQAQNGIIQSLGPNGSRRMEILNGFHNTVQLRIFDPS